MTDDRPDPIEAGTETFEAFLSQRLAGGGFTTVDTLGAILPLIDQAIETHARGLCAPLEGPGALRVRNGQIWYEQSAERPRRSAGRQLARLDPPLAGGVEVVGEQRTDCDVDQGTGRARDLHIVSGDEPIPRPAYLPGYVAWEHRVGHHDPVADVHSIGLLTASLACGLDFRDPRDLERFVAGRHNLFALAPELHPVLAKAIVRMTELSRHRRPKDLPAIRNALANYRDQDVDFQYELARSGGLDAREPADRQRLILAKLQERLFEISRRNRLLNFRQTLHTVNLTQASVPLSFDVERIRPEQLLTFSGPFAREALAGKAINLNRYVNLREVLYLPGVLEGIAREARRDQAEFGFAQLRLVAAFLSWADLKADPPERYDSPLVLLPATLTKKKGVRDTWFLEADARQAEINPVVRHQFKQLYDIDLPESIDLHETDLADLHQTLALAVQASEPGVAIERIDRPRIRLLHDRARRRLDAYRRRARVAGRGVRHFLDLDYSYDPANFHPLGLRLFGARVRTPETHLAEMLRDRPSPRRYGLRDENPAPPFAQRQKDFYQFDAETGQNPYAWRFDLCRVTLGNFRYRKMTLVRDYADLLRDAPTNDAFEATFSLAPKPREDPADPPLPADRFAVVPADPTQSSAIALARSGQSYIIQGPPGTGKSQTITNLIADYVARSRRVLFVCEKRAAIDVVHLRLRQRGLDELCCLIHDSQADKKDFVLDLKATYERMLADDEPDDAPSRDVLLRTIDAQIEPLGAFDALMRSEPREAGLSVRALLDRLARLPAPPELTDVQAESLGTYAEWLAAAGEVARFDETLRRVEPDGVFARHPLAALKPAVARDQRPVERVTAALDQGQALLADVRAALDRAELPDEHTRSPAALRELGEVLRRVEPLAQAKLTALLDAESDASRALAEPAERLARARAAHAAAGEATAYWTRKLPPDEARLALEQIRPLEARWTRWLTPRWYGLRKALGRCYDMSLHGIRPPWSSVLEALLGEYDAAATLDEARAAVTDATGWPGDPEELLDLVESLRRLRASAPPGVATMLDRLRADADPAEFVGTLDQAVDAAEELTDALASIFDDVSRVSLDEIDRRMGDAAGAIDQLPTFVDVLRRLGSLPGSLRGAIRALELDVASLEAAIAETTLRRVVRSADAPKDFDGRQRERLAARLDALWARLADANARWVRESVRQRFREHVRISQLPAAQLTDAQKDFKKRYARGRRELEHEFGKQMRYKPIRDLVAGESGEVVADLKPVWLMSPLSVSDTLPLDGGAFDVVIFDEASQITLEEAIPSLFRAAQAIVVGDEMQLPPTNFFSARREDEDDPLWLDDAGRRVEYDLGSDSFLNHAARNLHSRMLGWHYRSRSEALISFSNWAFYRGGLLTVPEEQLAAGDGEDLLAQQARDAETNVECLLDRPVSFHFMEHGCYRRRGNRAEAEYIAQLVRALLVRREGLSIGVVAFSEAQQGQIERALDRLADDDATFRDLLELELEREEDGQFVGLLVKNLENIQGDERDVVILSVCYGPDPEGNVRMNFGPINQSGGEKRLNVAFSRAKHHMVVVSSMRYGAIRNEYNEGANCLRNYLRYAEACSRGDSAAARAVLRDLTLVADRVDETGPAGGAVADRLADALQARGFVVDRNVGYSRFRCDLAVRREGDRVYRLGVRVDDEDYYRQRDLLEREVMKPKLLRAFGWRLAVVLAVDWHADRDGVVERLVELAQTPPGEHAAGAGGADGQTVEAEVEELLAAARRQTPPPADRPSPAARSSDALPAPAEPPAPDETAPEDRPPHERAAVTRRFELVAGRSEKFWEITVAGREYSVRYGRIGTRGREMTKRLDEPDQAARQADRLINQKIKKGYKEV